MSTNHSQTGRLSPQSQLQQRYMIVGQVGRGGMGAVYQATDTRIGHRRIAIKEMSQTHLDETQLIEATRQFFKEASMLGSLSHPNLPRIYDAFSEQGRSYLVMDFIEGQTLHQILKESHGNPLPVAQVLSYARQLCNVLDYLHRHNPPIIFRDVKPTNVMITENGHVYLIDFGIARFFKEGQRQDTVLLGSPGYAPPEQHGMSQTNPRSDIYGLGATLHYCLTGRDPYYAHDHFSFEPVRKYNPLVPIELDQLIQRMVARDERARPTSAIEVLQALITLSQRAEEYMSTLSPLEVPTVYPSPQVILPASPNAEARSQIPTVAVHTSKQVPIQPIKRHLATDTKLWNSGFMILFGGLLALILGSSIYALSLFFTSSTIVEFGSAFVTEFVLSLLLLLITLFASTMIRHILPRSILISTGIAALVSSLAFLTLGSLDVQLLFPPNSINLGSLDQISTLGLIVAAIISLCWLLRPFSKRNRITLFVLFGSAFVCMLVQFFASYSDTQPTKHIFLLIALAMLLSGVLLAAQMERLCQSTSSFQETINV